MQSHSVSHTHRILARRASTGGIAPLRRSLLPRSGLTLIEVVAGIALLSTLLVSTMLAYGLHVRQARAAQRRLEAIAAADRLLAGWGASAEHVPTVAQGEVPGDERLAWHTQVIENPAAATLGAAVIRLEVYDPALPDESRPLAAVEVLHFPKEASVSN
jgi:type II secretory pathway pseudopilin PulG